MLDTDHDEGMALQQSLILSWLIYFHITLIFILLFFSYYSSFHITLLFILLFFSLAYRIIL